jgi:hypothetical protein
MTLIKNKNILVALLALGLIMILPASLFAAQDVIAFFGEVKGDVTVTRANPGKTEPAKIGMFLHPGDGIKTGSDSYTSIIFQDDGSRVKLEPNTNLTLEAKRQKKRLSKKMTLGAGKMWAKVSKKRGTDFQVTTPTSVASVKGTNFGIEEMNWPETHVWVLEDQVWLTNGVQTFLVNQGEHGISTPTLIRVEDIGDAGCAVIDQGDHKLRFQFADPSGNVKDLIIEFEK